MRYNKEVYRIIDMAPTTSFIKEKIIQLLGHVIRKEKYCIDKTTLGQGVQKKRL